MTDINFSSGSRRKLLLEEVNARGMMRRRRKFYDNLSRFMITLAGLFVVLALLGIFIYLFSEAGALFPSEKIQRHARYELVLPDKQQAIHVAIDANSQNGVVLSNQGVLYYYRLQDGVLQTQHKVVFEEGERFSRFAANKNGLLLLSSDQGNAVLLSLDQYDQQKGLSAADYLLVNYPLSNSAPRNIAFQSYKEGVALAFITEQGLQLELIESLSEQGLKSRRKAAIADVPKDIAHLLLDAGLRHLYLITETGVIHHYSGDFPHEMEKVGQDALVSKGNQLMAISWLAGAHSFITGSSDGRVTQWMPVRDEIGDWRLARIRAFTQHDAPVNALTTEVARRSFVSQDSQGELALHHATIGKTLVSERIGFDGTATLAAFSPSNDLLWLVSDGQAQLIDVYNPHPELSFSALWETIWYEGRVEPEYVWQSSSASDVFEPKLSFVPLMSGTIKAALYSLLFAVPLAIMAAIYTAYFMKPALRRKIKPSIEMMEAMPTVILGFLAGLWLAPFIEQHLPAVVILIIALPLSFIALSWVWSLRPGKLKKLNLQGYEVLILVPLCIAVGAAAIGISPVLEGILFDGSMRQWLNDQGIHYDQRNAMIVGIAMGFAVIPSIYSIAEDAIFHVPKHLSLSSLALGASSWQTLWRVVLVTASPGIFSAVMMGFGRAIGETMIVLMATGNSPVTGFNALEGMRSLAATIAMELPEATVDSSHFRILFLAALMLFMLTFIANTCAELIRERLRRRYSAMQAGA